MVTFCFFLIFTLLLVITTIFDMMIYKQTILKTLHSLFFSYVGAGRYIAYMSAGVGLICSIIIDYRLRTNKKAKKPSQTDLP